jgi:hypothetical protein
VLWTLVGYLLFREHILKFEWDRSFLDPSINPLLRSTGIDRLLMPVVLFGRYVALLIAPIHLCPDYGGGAIGSHARLTDPYLWLGALSTLAFLVACVFASVRRARATLFCLLAFAVLYGIVSNLLALIGTNFAERLMYIPSAFLCVPAAILLLRLPRRAAITISTVVLILFSIRTVTYAAQWNDPTVLLTRAIAHQPKAVQLYMLLGEERQRHGDVPGARRALAQGRAVAPDYYRVWLLSARVALETGDPDAALRFASRSFDLQPTVAAQNLMAMAHHARATAATTRSTIPKE